MATFTEEEVEAKKKALIDAISAYETNNIIETLEGINAKVENILSSDVWNTIGGNYFMSKLSDSVTETGNRSKTIQVYSRRIKNADISYQLNRSEYGSHLITKTTGSTK